jgi:hypothetical protein
MHLFGPNYSHLPPNPTLAAPLHFALASPVPAHAVFASRRNNQPSFAWLQLYQGSLVLALGFARVSSSCARLLMIASLIGGSAAERRSPGPQEKVATPCSDGVVVHLEEAQQQSFPWRHATGYGAR